MTHNRSQGTSILKHHYIYHYMYYTHIYVCVNNTIHACAKLFQFRRNAVSQTVRILQMIRIPTLPNIIYKRCDLGPNINGIFCFKIILCLSH